MRKGRANNLVGPQVRRLRSEGGGISQDALAARCSVLGFDIGRGTISRIETGLRGVSDLEMVILARALRVPLDELVPDTLPPWKKDLRPPTAKDEEAE